MSTEQTWSPEDALARGCSFFSLPGQARTPALSGTVVAVGPEARTLRVGSRVRFPFGPGVVGTFAGWDYLVLREGEVLGETGVGDEVVACRYRRLDAHRVAE